MHTEIWVQPCTELPPTNVCLPRATSRNQYSTLWNEEPNASSKGDQTPPQVPCSQQGLGLVHPATGSLFPQKLSPLFCAERKAVTHTEKKIEGAGRRKREKIKKGNLWLCAWQKPVISNNCWKLIHFFPFHLASGCPDPFSRKPLFTETGVNLE